MIPRRAAPLAFMLLALLGAGSSARAQDTGKPTLVRVGIINAASSATFWALPTVATKYNLEIQEIAFQRFADARTALATGDIDISSIGPQDIALALSQGVKNIVALAGIASGGNCMVVRKGEDLTDWQSLKGHTIGIGAGSISWLMLAASVQENNVQYSALRTVNIVGGGAPFIKALQDKQIDMMVVWQPFCAQAVVAGIGQYPTINHRLSRTVGALDGVLAATKQFMARDPAGVDRLMRAYVELVTNFQADKSKWTDLYAAKSGIDPALAAESVRNADLNYTFSRAQMVRMAKYLADTGITPRDVSAELPQYIDYGPLMKATGKTEAELGGGAN